MKQKKKTEKPEIKTAKEQITDNIADTTSGTNTENQQQNEPSKVYNEEEYQLKVNELKDK